MIKTDEKKKSQFKFNRFDKIFVCCCWFFVLNCSVSLSLADDYSSNVMRDLCASVEWYSSLSIWYSIRRLLFLLFFADKWHILNINLTKCDTTIISINHFGCSGFMQVFLKKNNFFFDSLLMWIPVKIFLSIFWNLEKVVFSFHFIEYYLFIFNCWGKLVGIWYLKWVFE